MAPYMKEDEHGRSTICSLYLDTPDYLLIRRSMDHSVYERDASHNSKTGGFGIGLSVVYAIVIAHKGKISAKSEDGKSVIFTVVL